MCVYVCVMIRDVERVSMALLLLAQASQSSEADDASGSGEATEPGTNVSVKLVVAMTVVAGTGLITALVVGTVLLVMCKAKQRHGRNSPRYLGSCRRIDSVRRNVNTATKALKRAPPLHCHHHPVSSRLQQQQQQEEDDTTFSLPTTSAATLGSGRHHTQRTSRSQHRRTDTNPEERRVAEHQVGELESSYSSCYELARVGSLSRTYTHPNLMVPHTDCEKSNSYMYVNERLSTARSSAPCLTASYLVPLQMQEDREVHPIPNSAKRQPIYMGLNPRTMEREDSNHYETICRARQSHRAGQLSSAVGTTCKSAVRRPPPRLISKKTNNNIVEEPQSRQVMTGDKGEMSCEGILNQSKSTKDTPALSEELS